MLFMCTSTNQLGGKLLSLKFDIRIKVNKTDMYEPTCNLNTSNGNMQFEILVHVTSSPQVLNKMLLWKVYNEL